MFRRLLIAVIVYAVAQYVLLMLGQADVMLKALVAVVLALIILR